MTEHDSFDVVGKHPDVLRTALVCIHSIRCDSLTEPLENMYEIIYYDRN